MVKKHLTKTEFAKSINWPTIMWIVGFANVFAVLPQFFSVLYTKETEGLSISMLSIFLVVQIALSTDGYFRSDRMPMVCFGISSIINISTIVISLYFRHFA
jgi:uncharacterized protein with PQ loop repeat